MKVEGPGSPRPSGIRKKGSVGGASGSDFASRLGGVRESGESAPAASARPVASVDGVLAVQAADDPTTGRRRAVARGKDLLDQLDRLRLALLEGRLSADQLARLASRVAEQRDQVTDPALSAVLDEIELRAAVELAKLERAR